MSASPDVVRAWAVANGWPQYEGKRGRLSADVWAAYERAQGTATESRTADRTPGNTTCRPAIVADSSGLRLSYDDGHSVLKLDGVEVFRHPRAAECGKWAREHGYSIVQTRPTDYQAIDPYREARPKRKAS